MEAAMTHWDKERIQAQDEIRQIERERALEQIALLMRHHRIGLDELDTLTTDASTPIAESYVFDLPI